MKKVVLCGSLVLNVLLMGYGIYLYLNVLNTSTAEMEMLFHYSHHVYRNIPRELGYLALVADNLVVTKEYECIEIDGESFIAPRRGDVHFGYSVTISGREVVADERRYPIRVYGDIDKTGGMFITGDTRGCKPECEYLTGILVIQLRNSKILKIPYAYFPEFVRPGSRGEVWKGVD